MESSMNFSLQTQICCKFIVVWLENEWLTKLSCMFKLRSVNHLCNLILTFKDPLNSYDTSFLKRLQLVRDGDIESNPGPDTGKSGTPTRGRPKKSGFRGTLRKNETNSVPRKLVDEFPNFEHKDKGETVNRPLNVECNSDVMDRVSIIQSDITTVRCDAIVNAANVTLLGGGGIDKVIHEKAGKTLLNKCKEIPVKGRADGLDVRCYPGKCEVTSTKGTNLTNCSYVFHTVGPDVRNCSDMNVNEHVLRNCYESCLREVLRYNINSIAFCCISTGIYGYKNDDAAVIALDSVMKWLEQEKSFAGKIIFCTYTSKDYGVYNELMNNFFLNNTLIPEMLNKHHLESLDLKRSDESDAMCSKTDGSKIQRTGSDAINIDFNLTPMMLANIRDHNIPLGLRNDGVNACFFNSVMQVLYCLSKLREYIQTTIGDNRFIAETKKNI